MKPGTEPCFAEPSVVDRAERCANGKGELATGIDGILACPHSNAERSARDVSNARWRVSA
ncbi:MAG: hypothetical protein NVSMB25_21860 [Thermoleophilaceae bacterium]